ncbi:UbiA family prenyltransferase [Natrarchaeobaculum sulfurireducens]|uniref:1,4-dihydroxy-2-naphthoate octaprenyltransferase n=1 Tax=Natrarchaeobaculum sulfurireducens TaxID=2044521 RepID=A0A346PRB2_9EURY|nr:UbiA family prenyltransferase [Natrarchaeobaculum sulfurireducens]AXR77951.1 1,4-dihydroxy-2-naphthoate octaprenyltransferase [Natrarchaeobaculum sulfurireducens]AXR82057.1 1,4-dihydroxy-2-naphthoate octaprenyltransferase [Natrarchaeobaculum sulfurireducens]
MSLVRHEQGTEATARAYWSQVHPVFMLPPIAASLFGAILAGYVSFALATVHAVATFAAVYTAHVKDGYVDFHVRGEDDDHPLTERGCRVGLVASTGVFALCCLFLVVFVDWVAALLTIPLWLVAYHHAPQLDTNPLTATTGYPFGIALALVGGYYVQTEALAAVPLAFAFVFLVLLSGIKVVDDTKDYDYDRSIQKRTVAVAVGPARATAIAYGLMATALLVVVAFAVARVFPPTAVLAALAFGAVALVARRAPPELATMLLVRGSYVFLAVLVAAVWFEPLTDVL